MTGTRSEGRLSAVSLGRRLQAQEEDTNWGFGSSGGKEQRPGGWKAEATGCCLGRGTAANPRSWECAPAPVQGAQLGPQKDGSLVRTSHRGSVTQLCSQKPRQPPARVPNLPGLSFHTYVTAV